MASVAEFAWNSVEIRVIFGVRSERRKVDWKSKPTWKLKHANSILETFEYFWELSSNSIFTILSYTVSKLVHFWDTVYHTVNGDRALFHTSKTVKTIKVILLSSTLTFWQGALSNITFIIFCCFRCVKQSTIAVNTVSWSFFFYYYR